MSNASGADGVNMRIGLTKVVTSKWPFDVNWITLRVHASRQLKRSSKSRNLILAAANASAPGHRKSYFYATAWWRLWTALKSLTEHMQV